MKHALLTCALTLCCLLTGCAGGNAEQTVEQPTIADEPEEVESFEVKASVPALKLTPAEIKKKDTFSGHVFLAYAKHKDKAVVITETEIFKVKSLSEAKRLYACSEYSLPVMAKINWKGTITDWYVVYNNEWYKPESVAEIRDLYRVMLGDVYALNYPFDGGTTAKISGHVTAYSRGIMTFSVNGAEYKVLVGDTYDTIGTYATLDVVMNKDGMWQNAAMSVEDVPTEYIPPKDYVEIRPVTYDVEKGDISLHTENSGDYTVTNEQTAELLTLAYQSGIQVFVKTSESIFEVVNYVLVDANQELDINDSETFMSYINKRNSEKVKPAVIRKSKMKLVAATPTINLRDDATDERFDSYHYVIMADKNDIRFIFKYTSDTKGLDYLDLETYLGKCVSCDYEKYILHNANGNYYNFILNGVHK